MQLDVVFDVLDRSSYVTCVLSLYKGHDNEYFGMDLLGSYLRNLYQPGPSKIMFQEEHVSLRMLGEFVLCALAESSVLFHDHDFECNCHGLQGMFHLYHSLDGMWELLKNKERSILLL